MVSAQTNHTGNIPARVFGNSAERLSLCDAEDDAAATATPPLTAHDREFTAACPARPCASPEPRTRGWGGRGRNCRGT